MLLYSIKIFMTQSHSRGCGNNCHSGVTSGGSGEGTIWEFNDFLDTVSNCSSLPL